MRISFSEVNNLSLKAAALWYAKLGIRVFPCHDGEKTPRVHWKEAATTDPGMVSLWWDHWPDANIGLALGNHLHALDVDLKNDQDGTASLMAAGGEPHYLIEQPVQVTPNGGYHILFASKETFSNFTRRGSVGGLDMRTDGGYILAAPSRLPKGAYAWEDGDVAVPLREELIGNLKTWSRPSTVDRALPFPMPEPEDLMGCEIQAMIISLGEEHANFLRTGECFTGDRSRQAWLTCRHAFGNGGEGRPWSLRDMAAVLPHTVLATYGADPPHGAADPIAWCWKYTIRSAWESVGKAADMFKDEGPEADEDPGEEDPEDAPVVLPSFSDLQEQVKALPLDNLQAVRAYLQDVATADLQPGEDEFLLQQARSFSGLNLTILRPIYKSFCDIIARKKMEDSPKIKIPEVYVRDQGRFYDRISQQLISKDAFALAKAREYGGSPDNALSFFLTGVDAKCEIAESLIYDPGLPEGVSQDGRGVRVLNTYRGSAVIPRGGSVDMWLGLLKSFKLEGGRPEMEGLLDRMAFVAQYPGKKFNHGILIGGEHGIGKDSFLEPLIRIVGRANVNQVNGGSLGGDFNAWQAKAKLVVLNELDFGSKANKKEISELLKPALASPPETLEINEKNIRPYSIPNRLQCFGFTNHRGALHTDLGERRWYALWCEMQLPPQDDHPIRKGWDQFFIDYWKWLDRGGTEAIYAWLLARDISHFNPTAKPPTSVWLDEMRLASQDPLEALISEQIEQGEGAFQLGVLDAQTMVESLRAATFGTPLSGRISQRSIGQAVRSMGFEVHRVQQRISGRNGIPRYPRLDQRRTVYVLHPGEKADQAAIDRIDAYRASIGIVKGRR